MIFNGVDFKEFLKVEEVRRSILPPMVVDSHEVPGMHGSKPKRVTLGDGMIEVDIRLIKGSRSEVQAKVRELAYRLYTEEPARLYLPDEPDKYNMATLSGDTNLEKWLYTGGATLVFVCNDPIAYGESKEHSISDSTTLLVGGTYKTKPKVTYIFTESCNYVELRNLTSGKYVRVNHEFVSGDILILDFNDKWKARKNGVVIAEDVAIESDFFSLGVGENELTSKPAGLNPTIEYAERWL